MISRRQFLALSALGALAPGAVAQVGRAAKIGILGPSPLETSLYAINVVRAFTELGYAEGARATFFYRYADGGFDLYRKQAQDLAGRDCDLLIAIRAEPPARALQYSRPGGPILFLAVFATPVLPVSCHIPSRITQSPRNDSIGSTFDARRAGT